MFDAIHILNYLGIKKGYRVEEIKKIFPDSKIYCVDNWIGTEEYNNLNFESLENNFDRNLKEFNNVIKNKCTSDQFFENNNSNFDLIYIDGYHKAEQVLKDFKNAWKVLNKNGILIFDDFIWKFFEKIEDNPCFVINAYLKDLNKEFKILKVSNSQLFIKKI